jgi:alkylated DNA repair protein alkB family protein 8
MEASVPGFILHRDFITLSREEELMKEIESQKWVVDYDRRLQYYGYRNELEKPYPLIAFPVPMPPLIQKLSEQIVDRGIVVVQPDQVIINEYLPGQGIRPHKDRNYFENQICGINLGSGCIMRFLKGTEVVDIEVPRRSLYVMQDEVRYKWKHAIPPRKKDMIEGKLQHRERRWSITYRKVKINKVKSINPEGKVAGMLKDIYGLTVQ